ncbi:MAG: voltage-gated potassium channel [Cyclobacteriaceae bacterium]|jgi:voltage-gated potassium channel
MLEFINVIKRLRIAGALFISIMVSGTVGYKILGNAGTTWVDALYMTGITVSTLGYHEVVSLDLHPYGRVFTLALVFSGFAVLTYFFSNLVALFIEGDIRRTFIEKRMIRKIEKMESHYIICGFGRVGRNIAEELTHTDHEFVIADADVDVFEKHAADKSNPPFLVGDCTDDGFLMRLGLDRARGLFVVAGNDNTNLVICLSARQLNPQVKIVARTKDVLHVNKMQRAGADRVISPNYIGGIRMAAEMLRPAAVSLIDELMRSDFDQQLEECIVPQSLDGKPISEFPIEGLDHTTILAMREQGVWRYGPPKSRKMSAGEHLVLITTPSDRQKLESRL